jgi:PPP family 3-phenylpropionic acid transporter
MSSGSPLLRFIALYGAQFSAYGVASPFLPGLLMQDGLGPGALGIVLAAGTGIRLFAGPYGGRLADRLGRAPTVFAGFAAASALIATGYAPARGLPLLFLVSVAHAAVLAPLTPISDALALGSAQQGRGFEYGWVRAAGSAAFIVGTLVSGGLVDDLGLGIIIWLNAGLLAATAALGWFLPNLVAGTQTEIASNPHAETLRSLFDIPVFRRLMLLAALIGGSHALHDSFEVIRWREAGLSAAQTSLLWSSSVIAEVGIFVTIGPLMLNRLGPVRSLALSAGAGVVRWSVAALTAWFPAMALTEPLHGLTFALLHLACMDTISRTVPARLAATAQAFYATVAMGAAAAAVTLASGPLYGRFGAGAFWFMAAMCLIALPLTPGLRPGSAGLSVDSLRKRPMID